MKNVLHFIFIFLFVAFMPTVVAAVQPEFNSVAVKDVREMNPDVKDWFVDAFLAGKYVEIQRSGNAVFLSVRPNWPGYPIGKTITIDTWDGPSPLYEFPKDSDLIWKSLFQGSTLLGDLFVASPNDPKLLGAVQATVKSPAPYFVLRLHQEHLKELLVDGSLGYPPGTLWRNPSLKYFIKQNHIDQLAPLYGHKFGMGMDRLGLNGPMMLHQGSLVPWRDLYADLRANFEKDTFKMRDHVYTIHGIEPGTPDGAIRLIQEGGKSVYGERYVMEVIQGKEFNHYWLRFHYPNGETYSAGWQSTDPFSISWTDYLNPMYSGPYFRGKVVSPAPEEGTVEYQEAIKLPIELTAEQMAQSLDFVREYQLFPDLTGDERPIGTKGPWHFVYINLKKLGVAVPFFQKQWVSDVKQWREAQLQVLKTNGASDEEMDHVRFALPPNDLLRSAIG